MKRVFSLLVALVLIFGNMTVPTLAITPSADNILWDAETNNGLTDGVTLKADKTTYAIDDQHFPGTFRDAEDWNGKYDMIGALLPEVISNKVVNLSFDYYPEASAWGAPCFRVDVFEQNEAYAEGSDKWYLGFYAYDEPGQNDHKKVDDAYPEYYDETKSFFTYYGNESKANSEPYDKTEGKWVNGTKKIAYKKWQHIDCVYDLVNKTVSFYVDGEFLGKSAGPSAIGALAFRKKNYADSKTVYYGVARFDNIRLSEIKEGNLEWETETEVGQDSFLLNFSEPVNVLAKGMISITDMETLEQFKASSVKKITPYQWRITLDNPKKDAEYKVDITALTGAFGSTPKTEIGFAYTKGEDTFGIKKVRYDAKISNTTETVADNHSDDFSTYTAVADPGLNKENTNDYAAVEGSLWSRSGHTQAGTSYWGQGTYVNKGMLCIDAYSNINPITIGAIRQIKDDASIINSGIVDVSFDMAYYVLQRHAGSSFTMYAGEYPIFGADMEKVYLYQEQLTDEKDFLGNNTFAKASYGEDLKNVQLRFDFDNKEIRINFDGVIKTTPMYEDLAENGITNLKFSVNLLEGIVGGNGDYRGNAFVVDNYIDAIISTSNTPIFAKGICSTEKLASTTSGISIEFYDAVGENEISDITIVDENGEPVTYTPSMLEDGKTIMLAVALEPETSYTLTVPTTAREYKYSFETDSAIKFFDEDGELITQEKLAETAFAEVKVLVNAPGETGKAAYVYGIFDKSTDLLKDIRIEEISYSDGDVLAYNDAVKISTDEYAKVFLLETLNTLSPMDKKYTFGK